MKKFNIRRIFLLSVFSAVLLNSACFSVTSQITRHSTADQLLKGKVENTVIDSEGTIKLARQAIELDCGELLKDVWSINTIVATPSGAVYLGTSPNGEIIRFSRGKATKIYPDRLQIPEPTDSSDELDASDLLNDEPYFSNEHVFAMTTDIGGRLLAGISGENCRLLRFDNMQIETLFQPEGAAYIFAITLDEVGNIYVGTGPKGRIYRLDPFGKMPGLICDTRDKNVLSLAVDKNGIIYAGCDRRGIVYKIDPTTKTTRVLYDSEQSEITALLLDDKDNLYAAATSAKVLKEKALFGKIIIDFSAGRPDSEPKGDGLKTSNSTNLKVANTKEASDSGKSKAIVQASRGDIPKSAGYIYKISPQGFVTDVLSEMAVFFTMASQDDQLILGTGNNARLYVIDIETEQKTVAYEDKQASQITALSILSTQLYLGTANPPKLMKLARSFAKEGSYICDLVDAGQPAKWGKLQINADIPAQCEVLLSTRSGNVKDPNDPAFSPWTEPVQVTTATEVTCPVGRFFQYKLTLKSKEADETPIIREVALSHVVPNLVPRMLSVNAAMSSDKNKKGVFNISYETKDDNKDKLIYNLEFRKLGRGRWIELKDKFSETKFEWDTKTVEDGRYEVKITASDHLSNTTTTKLSTSRISEPFVVDNTPPMIEEEDIEITNKLVTIKLRTKDEFTAIGKVNYTIDSNTEWTATLPQDSVYDTTVEDFTIVIEDLDEGEHVVALRISDDVGNTMYKSFDVDIKSKP